MSSDMLNDTSSTASPASRKKGLLLAPRFPADSFWSYRYVMKMIGAKTAFPPLGLLTFAADMPAWWSFKLFDLNVWDPPESLLRKKIAEADAVFVSAMSIQKRSLVELLQGPAAGLNTPWVLGGPFPSTYRDQILDPNNKSDQVLHEGLDLLVWGESFQWIDAIDQFLKNNPDHSPGKPKLLIPEAVLKNRAGRRGYLNDRSLFKPLAQVRPPRWDLIRASDYRSLMIQTTVGCPFRCDFCDIIDFNGGFTRVKSLEDVRRELEAIYDTGHRGGLFTVDDNFIGNPTEIVRILDLMIDFQREHDYPFCFYTQASVNLGQPKHRHLIEKMRRAGFVAVFLGIENPDPAALKAMNKKQNKLVNIPETVSQIQQSGIEVYGGFIFGTDADTFSTAQEIVRFVKETAICTAMTGMLTPVPHTPLYERLRDQERLMEAEYTGNNTDDAIQFMPRRMTPEQMQAGIHQILQDLFNSSEYFRRSRDLLTRMEQHIYTRIGVRMSDLKAACRSVWEQGIRRRDFDYFRLIGHAVRLDWRQWRSARRRARQVERLRRELSSPDAALPAEDKTRLLGTLLKDAGDYMIRFRADMSLEQILQFSQELSRQLQSGCTFPREMQRQLYRAARGFLQTKMAYHRFPGQCLAHAFELAIQGLHYQKVTRRITKETVSEEVGLGWNAEGFA